MGSGLVNEKRNFSALDYPRGQALSSGKDIILPLAPMAFLLIRPDPRGLTP